MRHPTFAILISINSLDTVQSFTTNYNNVHISNNKFSIIQKNNQQYNTRCISSSTLGMTIVSPFDNTATEEGDELSAPTEQSFNPLPSDDEPLDLTWDNVDMVLDEMRPYLLQDGGNVAISEIDGPIVRLELQVCVCIVFVINCDCEIIGEHSSFCLSPLNIKTLGRMWYMSKFNTNNENGFGTQA